MSVFLNSDKYPKFDYDLNIAENKFSRVYGDLAKFRSDYTGVTPELAHCNISPSRMEVALSFLCV